MYGTLNIYHHYSIRRRKTCVNLTSNCTESKTDPLSSRIWAWRDFQHQCYDMVIREMIKHLSSNIMLSAVMINLLILLTMRMKVMKTVRIMILDIVIMIIRTLGHPAVFDNYWPEEWNANVINRFLKSYCIAKL